MNGGESDMNHEMNDTVSLLLMVTMFQSVARPANRDIRL